VIICCTFFVVVLVEQVYGNSSFHCYENAGGKSVRSRAGHTVAQRIIFLVLYACLSERSSELR
jgi:hypothetical protein